MFTPSRTSLRSTVRTRLAVALTLLGGVSLVQPAFAGKPVFERKKPHVNVGTIGQPGPTSGRHVGGGAGLTIGIGTPDWRGATRRGAWNSLRRNAEAQRYVSEINARATIQAAREAAAAQKLAASQVDHRRWADVSGRDRFNLGQRDELWERSATPGSDMDQAAYYRATMAELDAIDLYYGSEGGWGTGEGVAPYSYSE
jgi:hypothetical protein